MRSAGGGVEGLEIDWSFSECDTGNVQSEKQPFWEEVLGCLLGGYGFAQNTFADAEADAGFFPEGWRRVALPGSGSRIGSDLSLSEEIVPGAGHAMLP